MHRTSQGRIGFLWPADGLNDDEFWRFVPRGVAWLTSRYDAGDGSDALTVENFTAFADPAVVAQAAGVLRAAHPDVLACGDHAAGFIAGNEGEAGLVAAMSRRLGCPAVTMAGAVIEALTHFDATRIAVASPYSDAVTERLVAHLGENGLHCTALQVFGETDEDTIGTRSAECWVAQLGDEFLGQLHRSGADALVFAGGGVRLADAIVRLEARLALPVVTGPGALVWAAARRLGITPIVPGVGRLFADPSPMRPAAIRTTLSPATKTYAVSQDPPLFTGAAGPYLLGSGHRSWLDFACGSGTTSLGHGHPAIMQALADQAATGLLHVGPHFHSTSQERLFNALHAVLPPHLDMIHPSVSGAEATECALKAAMHATGARHFIAFEGGYHGRTLGAMAVSAARGPNRALEPFSPSARLLPFPQDSAAAAQVIAQLCAPSQPLAGLVIEPVQATAGLRIAAPEALRAIADAARDANIPLIADEVFSGFGRTGPMFGFDHAGIDPDIVILGKSFGGGLPAAAITGRRDILGQWPKGAQSATFQLHPAAAASAAAMIETVNTPQMRESIARIGTWLARDLPGVDTLPGVRATSSIGAFGAVEMTSGTRALAARNHALEHGLVTWGCGAADEVIGLVPPFILGEDEWVRGMALLKTAIRATSAA